MSSVTERIAKIKQPYGGFVPSKVMTVTQLNDNNTLHPLSSESVHPSIMGTDLCDLKMQEKLLVYHY